MFLPPEGGQLADLSVYNQAMDDSFDYDDDEKFLVLCKVGGA
jgi:hypothetical protein